MLETVALIHPKLPGVTLYKSAKRAESMALNGWKVQPKSTQAPAGDETKTPDKGNSPKEGPK